MNDYQRNYIYLHIDPQDNGAIVYVGHGTNERAWRCTSYKGAKNGMYGHRSAEHAEWCQELILKGFVPSDWVVIFDKNLSKQDALEKEYELIKELKPKFNKPYGVPSLLVGEKLEEAKKLRKEGLYYSQISDALDVSTMTVWRALKNGND